MGELDFDAFVAARALSLTKLAYLLTGDRHEAEDLVQSALAKAYVSWRKVVRADHPEAYVRRIIVTTHLSRTRRLSFRREQVVAELPDRGQESRWADPGETVAARDELRRALATLPLRQRTAVVLRFYGGLDDAAVAAQLGCREVTVRASISRGLAQLRQVLGADDLELSPLPEHLPTAAGVRPATPTGGDR